MLYDLEYTEGNGSDHARYDGSVYDEDSEKAHSAIAYRYTTSHPEKPEKLTAVRDKEKVNTANASRLNTTPTALSDEVERATPSGSKNFGPLQRRLIPACCRKAPTGRLEPA